MLDFIFLDFQWHQLLQPQWYILNGGLWFVLLVVFAETGLFAGFFLPGDSLLFVAGISAHAIEMDGKNEPPASAHFYIRGSHRWRSSSLHCSNWISLRSQRVTTMRRVLI